MVKKVLLIFVLGLISVNCNQNDKKYPGNRNAEEWMHYMYEVYLMDGDSIFGKSKMDHFPDTRQDTSKIGGDFSSPLGSHLTLFQWYFKKQFHSEEEYLAERNKFQNTADTIIYPTDTDLLLIFDYIYLKFKHNGDTIEVDYPDLYNDLVKHNNQNMNSYPVPYFDFLPFERESVYGLPNDFELFILETNPGIYLKHKETMDCFYLPEKWKNGMSRGIAFSDSMHVAIYWTVGWQ